MWETIKNDPILKTVTIIILSVLGFGFAFNIMFGPNNSGMEHSGMEHMTNSGGYSLENTLSYIFILVFKILLIALVIATILAVVRLAKKYLLEGGEIKVFDSIKKDPVLKGITVIVLLIIAFGLIYYLFSELFGFGSRYGMMNGYMMVNTGYGLGLSGLLAILLKLLLVVLIAGLIIGLVMYIKESYGKEIVAKVSSVKFGLTPSVTCSHCGAEASAKFKFCPHCGEKVKEECTSCGAELKKEWKCCPACGTEKGEKE
jgi:hypothetical protein